LKTIFHRLAAEASEGREGHKEKL